MFAKACYTVWVACGYSCLNGVDAMNTVKKKLTHKQNEFVKEYLINGNNGTLAAIKAKYSKNTAAEMAYENLNKPHIIEEIEKRQVKIAKKAENKFDFSVEKRLSWLNDIRLAGMETYTDKDKNDRRENLSASVSSIKEMSAMLGINSDDEDNSMQPITKIEIEVIGANVKD
jgi:phage terminase small subunit